MNLNITPAGVVKFLKRSFSALFLLCLLNSSVQAQYCTPTIAFGPDEIITKVILGTINNPSGYTGGYTNYTALSTAATAGTSVSFTVTYAPVYTGDAVYVWVDYNNNGSFLDAGEAVAGAITNTAGTYAATFTIPTGTTAGTKRVRFRLVYNDPPNPCANVNYGETEDYSLVVSVATPCTGTPAPGNTVSTVTTGCAGSTFTLSPQNTTSGSGVTYQYQSSPTATGTYTNILGATSATYAGTVTATAFYQVLVTCSGVTTASNPVQITLTPANQCYCTPTPSTFGCNSGDVITNVTVGGINNTSVCGNGGTVVGYSNYATTVAAGSLFRSASNPISVNFPGGFTEFVGVWVDYNQSGTFDATEFTSLGSTGAGGPLTGNLVIPASALLGPTRIRVKLNYAGAVAPTSACTGSGFGEIEDYTVNIVDCVPITITGQPANASAACSGNATFTVTVAGSLPAYQWEYRVNATSPWLIVPNAPPYSGVNTATLTITGVTGAMSGYQYRAIVSGACTGPDFSNAATLTVTPIQLAITPSVFNKCASGPAVLIAAPSTQFVVSGTNNTAVPVPDNTAAGANSVISLAGIPAGASIQKIDVKFNMPHTYVGDMIFNLKAPGGQIINLVKYMGGTGNQAGTYPNIGFVNTIISSLGTAPLSGVTAQPVTGTFKADLLSGAIPGFPIANPTGFTPTTTSWTTLAPNGAAANGAWTLAMADGGPADLGTLTNWTITITYGGAPATVVFTPTAGLFTDAAGTIPYTGGSVTQVYAAPTSNATYQAVITAGACSTVPQTITVNVNTPAGGSPTLSNTSICVGSNGFLKPGGTLTGGPGFIHTYQVKAPGATIFTNITAGGVYSFSGDSLKLTNVPLSLNGYQFRDSISTGGNCGSVISTIATLSVNPIPVVTISVAPRRNLFPGLTTTLTAAVSGVTPPVTYQWFRNGVAVPNATNNTLVVGIDGLGSYTVKATAQGCSNADSTTTPQNIVIGDSTGVKTLFIYPSPNSGQFQVRYFSDINNGSKSPAQVNVYDQKGARVFTRNYGLSSGYQPMNVDLGTHSRGIYRVELTDLNGERIKTGTVLVF